MRKHLTFANVVACIALFVALGGSAIALKANSVGSRQVKDNALKGRDVRNGSLKGFDLAEATIGSREIDEAAFDLEPFVKMGSTAFGCDPGSAEFVSCGSVTLGLNEPSRAMLVGAGTQRGPAASRGECQLEADGQQVATTLIGDPAERTLATGNGFALTGTSSPAQLLQPGSNTFRILCNETGGDVSYSTTLSVVALGGTPG